MEGYEKDKFEFYTKDTFVQKLSYKIDQVGWKEDSIYTYLLEYWGE